VISALCFRLGDWLTALTAGAVAYDPVVTALIWSAAFWAIAAWMAWGVQRREQPFAALLPGITLLAGVLGYTHGNPDYLLVPLGTALVLTAVVSRSHRERAWQKSRLDSPRPGFRSNGDRDSTRRSACHPSVGGAIHFHPPNRRDRGTLDAPREFRFRARSWLAGSGNKAVSTHRFR